MASPTETPDDIFLVRKLNAFRPLSTAARDDLARLVLADRKTVPARRDFMREGENPKGIHIVLRGWACRHKSLPDGTRQILAFAIPGDVIDHDIFMLREMDHSIGAITEVEIATISRTDYLSLEARHADIRDALRMYDLVVTAILREWILNVARRTALARIAHLMCELYLRLARIGLVENESYSFPLTQGDIADAIGVTTVHVNRMVNQLRNEGLIRTGRGTLCVLDLDRLKQVAMFDDTYLHLQGPS